MSRKSRRQQKKYVTQKLSENIQIVSLAKTPRAVSKEDRVKKIIKHGLKNEFPEYLLWLYYNSPSHGAIVNGKARYLKGLCIKPKEPNAMAEAWLKQNNIYDLLGKQELDNVISGIDYTLIHPNVLGQPTKYEHLEFAKCRIHEDLKHVSFSNDWNDTRRNPVSVFPIWEEGINESAVYVYKRYSPSASLMDGVYPRPEWNSCLTDVDTDVEVNTFFNSLVRNNFSAGTIVTIFSGKISKEKQDEIKEELLIDGEGAENAGKTAFVFAEENAKGAEIASLNGNDLDKQYQEVSKRNLQNILIGHGVSAVLFKLSTPGALGQRNEMIEAHELFLNEYVKPEQEVRLRWTEKQFFLRTGIHVEFEIEQVKEIGMDYTDPNISKYLSNNEIRERLGLPINETVLSEGAVKLSESLNSLNAALAAKVLENLTEDELRSTVGLAPKNPIPAPGNTEGVVKQETDVNEHLKNLTGRQFQGLMRIVKKYDDEKISKETAIAMMTAGFGIDEVMAKTFLNIADEDENEADKQIEMNKQYSDFINWFNENAHEINFEDEVIDSFVGLEELNVNLAKALSINDIRLLTIQAVRENNKITTSELAELIGIDISTAKKALAWLKEKGMIEGKEGELKPTAKAEETEEIKTEIYTEYTYQLDPELKGEKILLPTSHQFCIDMVELTKKKALSFEQIDSMVNYFNMNAWDFRGGYTGVKGTKRVKPSCRHVWFGQTKIRKVKK